MHYSLQLDWPAFLRDYWQKKPCIVKRAFLDFEDPISAEELAGLALEDEIESRLVITDDEQWHVEQGPFSHFNHLGDEKWNLLVQAVDHWHPESAALVAPFRALPHWRFDDLMVSLSTPLGTVGPHIDQYDVFIIQGSGRRRWRVGSNLPKHKSVIPHPSLLLVKPFEYILDDILETGDMLYIPAGFPHEGVTLETALSYSVGFRAPNQQALLTDFADYVIDNELGGLHYSDPTLQLRINNGEILPAELAQLKQSMTALIDDNFTTWFGQFITKSLHELDIAAEDPPLTESDILHFIQSGLALKRLDGLRVLLIGLTAFVNGEALNMTPDANQLFSQHLIITAVQLQHITHDPAIMIQLTKWINKGYWYFINKDSDA